MLFYLRCIGFADLDEPSRSVVQEAVDKEASLANMCPQPAYDVRVAHERGKQGRGLKFLDHRPDRPGQPRTAIRIGFKWSILDEIYHHAPVVNVEIMESGCDAFLRGDAHGEILVRI